MHFGCGCHGHTPELKLDETEESLRQSIADFITRKDLRLHLYLKETGEFIGSSGLHRIDWTHSEV